MMLNSNLDSEELDENVQNGMDKLKKRFVEIEKLVNDLMGNQFDNAMDVTNGMNGVEKAKYYATIAYCIQSLYNVHLRLKNEETRIDSSNVELNRIKQSILKIKNAINYGNNNDNSNNDNNKNKNEENDVEMNGNGQRMKLDTAAAKRFIANSL